MDIPEHRSHPRGERVGGHRAASPDPPAERSPTGWPVTLRWIRVTAAIVVLASVVLALVLVFARG